jgi:oligopeptide/dipeptide ABC transporter ATP-binding protein
MSAVAPHSHDLDPAELSDGENEPGAIDAPAILRIENLSVRYATDRGDVITPVDDVSISIQPGETLGLVGESGCGKSTLGRAILRLLRPDAGSIVFDGRELVGLEGRALRAVRRHLQIIFQDPRGSLDPKMNVGEIVSEPLRVHQVGAKADRVQAAIEMLDAVGLERAYLNRNPMTLSGGQQQRVGIARALITRPKLVVCDEPVSALDLSVQAQVINLLQDLQRDLGVSYLFIAHNLAVVRHLSDRVAVMYLGQIVEQGPAHQVFARPLHPYTQGLLASVLRTDSEAHHRLDEAQQFVQGDVPSLHDVPTGCRYHTRCPFAQDRCREERPVLELSEGEHAEDHWVACHFWRDLEGLPKTFRAR